MAAGRTRLAKDGVLSLMRRSSNLFVARICSQKGRLKRLRAQRLARRREWRGARHDAELYQTEKSVPPMGARRPSEVEVTPGA